MGSATDVENLESLSSWITREGIFRVASEEGQERMTGELSNIQWK
jgi:hypothetical protein